ncbi:MAG: spore maturation protein [Lachnospiraceae bacterium]|nr:spore maturation protein [Lachnospiraceae bacterium]
MQLFIYISNLLVPMFILFVAASGLMHRRPVFDDFLRGAKSGLKTTVEILPSLVGLIMAVQVLRASGFMEEIAGWLGALIPENVLPGSVIPALLVRMFSNSAATGLALDVFEQYGPDSLPGLIVSIGLGATESLFYVMSVYLGSVGVRKSRYILPGALAATAAGLIVSVMLAGWVYQNGLHT